MWEDCRSRNTKETQLDIFGPLASVRWNSKRWWGWELKMGTQKEDPECSLCNHREEERWAWVSSWCLGHCQCQRKWACGAGLRSVTIKGSGMPLCRNLRSCPTVTVNLLQMRRVSKTYFLLETVQQRPYAWVGRCYRHLQAWTERPEGCRRADAEEMETNREDSWFGAQHPLPCPDYWLRSQNVPFRKLPLC